jgi:serine/threonine protein kinase
VIHRDIKPANILLTLDHPPTIRLIDFGIARPFKIGIPTQHDPIRERRNVPGTLHWVSLNAQLGYGALSFPLCLFYFAYYLCDLDTSRRDDVESLAYTLLFLLRGSLPWQRYNARSATLFGCIKQVREKKKQWPGQRLGEGIAKEFGDLLDYARALEFDSEPDYEGLRSSFQRLAGSQTEEALDFCGRSFSL